MEVRPSQELHPRSARTGPRSHSKTKAEGLPSCRSFHQLHTGKQKDPGAARSPSDEVGTHGTQPNPAAKCSARTWQGHQNTAAEHCAVGSHFGSPDRDGGRQIDRCLEAQSARQLERGERRTRDACGAPTSSCSSYQAHRMHSDRALSSHVTHGAISPTFAHGTGMQVSGQVCVHDAWVLCTGERPGMRVQRRVRVSTCICMHCNSHGLDTGSAALSEGRRTGSSCGPAYCAPGTAAACSGGAGATHPQPSPARPRARGS